MARNPDLIRAILAQPNDNNVRLVYADWLDENGDPKHAELIRVQCELVSKACPAKRKKQLQKREAELLADPGFHLPGQRPFQYERGFIPEGCDLALTRDKAELYTLAMPDFQAGSKLLPSIYCALEPGQATLLDRALRLNLNLGVLPPMSKWDDPAVREFLWRATGLECSECSIDLRAVKRLTKCPHLVGVTSIVFCRAHFGPLALVAELFLSPSLPNVTTIRLDAEEWCGEDLNDRIKVVDDKRILAFIADLGAAKKTAQLTHFQLNIPLGKDGLQVLLDAEHLRPTQELTFFANVRLGKTMKAALKKKFGKAVRL